MATCIHHISLIASCRTVTQCLDDHYVLVHHPIASSGDNWAATACFLSRCLWSASPDEYYVPKKGRAQIELCDHPEGVGSSNEEAAHKVPTQHQMAIETSFEADHLGPLFLAICPAYRLLP